MFVEVVVCAFIGINAVLVILTLWRMKYSRFVPDNKHSVFQVFLDAMDSNLFVTSGKKNALHLLERAKEAARSLLPEQHAQRIPHCLQRACADVGRVSARGNPQRIHMS
ncbi:hypothetical protein CDAR_234461 [Caerostris darwini]|uniref:Uncharacterized protein n=1 Tax=Caerostris darwini TaxID=1538125 RepID=A0AAV4TMZ8_9ARAC|nr:hypothetical protein CDAR_234461 [Caerostris darwini]